MFLPPIIGPVDTGAAFLIVSVQNTSPNVLVSSPISSSQGLQYYWEQNLSNIGQNGIQLPIFSSSGTLDNLTITDSINNGGLAFRTDGITIGHALQPAILKLSQPLFVNLSPPDVFLSAVQYTIHNSSGATGFIQVSKGSTGMPSLTIPANNIVILPVTWYFNCTASGSYDIINKPEDSLINWFCLVNPGIQSCSNISLAPGGWTNLPDCTVGNVYQYCRVNEICGNNNCNGPCPQFYDTCEFSSNTYSCTFDPDNFVNDKTWYQSAYFVGAIIAGIIMVFVIIILIFIVRRSNQQ